jgi:hypothetical protein
MELRGWCGVWLISSPSPPGPQGSDRHDETCGGDSCLATSRDLGLATDSLSLGRWCVLALTHATGLEASGVEYV